MDGINRPAQGFAVFVPGMSENPEPTAAPGPLAATRAMFAALQQRARVAGVTLRAPPPLPATCCGRGCHGCVWEGFHAAAAYWRQEAEQRLASCRVQPPA